MANIKERFKAGLHSTGEKLSNIALGPSEERQHRADVDFKVKDARRKGFEQGRIKGAYQEGYRQGKNRSRQPSGALGMLQAGVVGLERGLNAGASILGVGPDELKPRSPRRKRKRQRFNRTVDVDDLIF